MNVPFSAVLLDRGILRALPDGPYHKRAALQGGAMMGSKRVVERILDATRES